MFIQNQISHLGNHRKVIETQIDDANQLLFVVAYVRENGVDVILDRIKDKPTKLLCSLDMGITQLSGIKKLIENGVDVRVYQSNTGTFHPKIWLFGKNKTNWKMLIGSANLTRAALIDNVEASVLVEEQNTTSNALMFFNYLWDSENSSAISIDEVNSLQEKINERKAFKNKPAKIVHDSNQDDDEKIEILFEYVKSWIDIPKYASKGISSLWRGWYVIPDQGYVDDANIKHLKSYLSFIGSGITLGDSSNDENYLKLLDRFEINSNFQRENLKTSMHGLFIRQAKNYLLKFDWCYHPIKENGKLDKKILCLTDLGVQVNQCDNLDDVKKLYSDYFFNFSFNGLAIVIFTKRLLQKLDYLTLDEFNYFVIHAYNEDDFDIVVNLIKVYRAISNPDTFQAQVKNYFDKIKEPTGKTVYGNYTKSIKHTISVIGWCNGFSLGDELVLRLDDAV